MGKLTPEKERAIIESYKELMSYEKVARKLGVHPKTVSKVVQKDREKGEHAEMNRSGEGEVTASARNQDTKNTTTPHVTKTFAEFIRRRMKGDTLVQVTLDLDLAIGEPEKYEQEYLMVTRRTDAMSFYEENKSNIAYLKELENKTKELRIDAGGCAALIRDIRSASAEGLKLHGIKLEIENARTENQRIAQRNMQAQRALENTTMENARLIQENLKLESERKELSKKKEEQFTQLKSANALVEARRRELEVLKNNKDAEIEDILRIAMKRFKELYPTDQALMERAAAGVIMTLWIKPLFLTQLMSPEIAKMRVGEQTRFIVEKIRPEFADMYDLLVRDEFGSAMRDDFLQLFVAKV